MFIAHLPAGYILGKKLDGNGQIFKAAILGSIFPDIDLIYFYLIDARQTLHHDYWIHTPFYWLVIYAALALTTRKTKLFPLINAFHLGILLHLILDTIVGKIQWLYPFSRESFALFEVPALYDFWVWNFVLHWSFLFELAIILWALYFSRDLVESKYD